MENGQISIHNEMNLMSTKNMPDERSIVKIQPITIIRKNSGPKPCNEQIQQSNHLYTQTAFTLQP